LGSVTSQRNDGCAVGSPILADLSRLCGRAVSPVLIALQYHRSQAVAARWNLQAHLGIEPARHYTLIGGLLERKLKHRFGAGDERALGIEQRCDHVEALGPRAVLIVELHLADIHVKGQLRVRAALGRLPVTCCYHHWRLLQQAGGEHFLIDAPFGGVQSPVERLLLLRLLGSGQVTLAHLDDGMTGSRQADLLRDLQSESYTALFTLNGADDMDPYLNINNSGASNNLLGANEVAEAAVVLNAYSSDFGRMTGAQVNYIGKTGSNTFHGNLFHNYNDKEFNANDFINTQEGLQQPRSDSHQFGGSFGGPIKKNKLFFFFNYESLQYALPTSGAVYIPSPQLQTYTLAHIPAAATPLYQDAFALWSGASGAPRTPAP